jgi:hypothetical protein
VGELLQHDTSIHLWAPEAKTKWYLITTIDDHSRRILYGDLWEKETSWAHIVAAKSVITQFGCPLKYYVDNHAIFRFVEKRDTVWQKAHTAEGDAVVQWKEVLKDLSIEVVYALSPSAKGKVERPYQWLQDHLVRTCVRENISKIEEAQAVLYEEMNRYNCHRVHSTTQEIPALRYEKALQEKKSLLRSFRVPAPYETLDDIFCYRIKRVADSYRKLSWQTLKFGVSGVSPGDEVELRISFNLKTRMAKIRFWCKNKLVGEQQVMAKDLPKVHF